MLRLVLTRNARGFASQKAAPEEILPAAINLWEARHQKPSPPKAEDDDFFTHELFTPHAKPKTGILCFI